MTYHDAAAVKAALKLARLLARESRSRRTSDSSPACERSVHRAEELVRLLAGVLRMEAKRQRRRARREPESR